MSKCAQDRIGNKRRIRSSRLAVPRAQAVLNSGGYRRRRRTRHDGLRRLACGDVGELPEFRAIGV